MIATADDLAWPALTSLPVPYLRWNKAIGEYVFRRENVLRPVYLDIDADRLTRIAAHAGLPVEQSEQEFIAAVRSALSLDQAETYRRSLAGCARDAHNPDGLPFVALLALTVLAASKMTQDLRMAPHNYYGRLAQILGVKEKRLVEHDFPRVVDGWKALNEWLDSTHGGRFGLSTAREIGHWTRIGYPISQCLLREHDRRRLPIFFAWASLTSEDAENIDEISFQFRRWTASGSCRLSPQARARIRDESTYRLMVDLVARELEAWTGEHEEEDSGLRVAQVLLGLEFTSARRVELYLCPRKPAGFPDSFPMAASSQHALEDLSWYEPLPCRELPAEQRWRTADDRFQLQFTPKSTYALRQDESLGVFVETARLSLDDEAIVLASPLWVDRVRWAIGQTAQPGWQELELTGLPPGWTAFVAIRPKPNIVPDDTDLDWLAAHVPIGLSVAGGLRIDRGVWLVGGAPLARVHSPEQYEPLDVQVDGTTVATVPVGGGEVDLAALTLEPGEHTVTAVSSSRRVTLIASRAAPKAPPPTESYAWALRRAGRRFQPALDITPDMGCPPPAGVVRIRGAELIGADEDLPESIPEPVTFSPPCAREWYLIGAVLGRLVTVPGHRHLMIPPLWWDSCVPIIVEPPFKPQWLLRHGRKGRWTVQFIGDSQESTREAGDASETDIWTWAELICRRFRNEKKLTPDHRRLLGFYRSAAAKYLR